MLLHKSDSTLKPLALKFTIDWSFKIGYCMNFHLNLHRNYKGSKIEATYLLNKKQTSNFEHA